MKSSFEDIEWLIDISAIAAITLFSAHFDLCGQQVRLEFISELVTDISVEIIKDMLPSSFKLFSL